LRVLADLGDSNCQCQYGHCLERAVGVSINFVESAG
jgi:hypothetical protein